MAPGRECRRALGGGGVPRLVACTTSVRRTSCAYPPSVATVRGRGSATHRVRSQPGICGALDELLSYFLNLVGWVRPRALSNNVSANRVLVSEDPANEALFPNAHGLVHATQTFNEFNFPFSQST